MRVGVERGTGKIVFDGEVVLDGTKFCRIVDLWNGSFVDAGAVRRAMANAIHDNGWPIADGLDLAAKLIGVGFSAGDVNEHMEQAIELARALGGERHG